MPLEIEKMLVCSTNHITLDESSILDNWYNEHSIEEAPVYMLPLPRNDGWLLGIVFGNASDAYPQRDLSMLPANLQVLWKLALQNGCSYLRIDPDGPIIESLPTFEW